MAEEEGRSAPAEKSGMSNVLDAFARLLLVIFPGAALRRFESHLRRFRIGRWPPLDIAQRLDYEQISGKACGLARDRSDRRYGITVIDTG